MFKKNIFQVEEKVENTKSNRKVLLILEESDNEPEYFYLFDPDDSYRGDANSSVDELCHTGQIQDQQTLNGAYIDLLYQDDKYMLSEAGECLFMLTKNGVPLTNTTQIISTLNKLFKTCYVINEDDQYPSWYRYPAGNSLSDDDIEEMLEIAHKNYSKNKNI